MAERVVRLLEDFIALRWFQHKLVSALSLSPPESSVTEEEMPRTFNKFLALGRQQLMKSG
jgi:hypothetical protein